ncbi:MAG: PQQ-dependent sugar dehydrogenase [Bacillota bacterium]|nr:PQQ-dependent sugar dehydrogenase [Bacillota bacterium]
MKNRIFGGLLAGIMGGLAGALILWGSWLLPSLGLLLTRADIVNGASAVLVLGAVGGILYALVMGERRLRLSATILTGLALGVIFWFLGVLILVPVILGFPPQLTSPLDHWVPLVAFTFYGIIVSLLYSRWALRQPVFRTYLALGLIIVSGILTPIMLRAAMSTDPEDIALPEGFRAEVVAKGFTFPTALLMGENGNIYVAEAGFAYGPKTTLARVLMVRKNGSVEEIARDFEGPINGLAMKENMLYISHRGKITEFDLESKERKDLVKDLPSLGDHHNNDLIFGEDGALYFGQGSATNTGVVGSDNFVYAWLDRHPEFHDAPSRNFVLTGENYEALDLSTPGPTDTMTTGAFAPFGQKREEGEDVEKATPANAAIHRLDLETETLSIYADGLRNPYGLVSGPDGTIYATNLGYDDRGERAVAGSPDWIVKIKEGAWYGWPDYAGSLPLTDERFASERGVNLNPLIENPPDVEPPLTELPPHYSPMKLDWSPEGFQTQGLFVAIFGDAQPLTEDLEEQVPTGIINVDPESGEYEWFIKNKEKPRAGRLGDGLKRVVDVKFDQESQSMYVLDFGVMEFTDFAPNAIPRTGVLWKIEKIEAKNDGAGKVEMERVKKEEKTVEDKPVKPEEEPEKAPEQPGRKEEEPEEPEPEPDEPEEPEPEPDEPDEPAEPGNNAEPEEPGEPEEPVEPKEENNAN